MISSLSTMSFVDRLLGPTIISGNDKRHEFTLPGNCLYVTSGDRNIYDITITVPESKIIFAGGSNNLTTINNPNQVPFKLEMTKGFNNTTAVTAGGDEKNQKGTRIKLSHSRESVVTIFTKPEFPIELQRYKCTDTQINIYLEDDPNEGKEYFITDTNVKGSGNSIEIFTSNESE